MILPLAFLAAATVQAISINTYVFREGALHNCHGPELFEIGYSVTGQCTKDGSVYLITDCTLRGEFTSSTCSGTPTATSDLSDECQIAGAQNEFTYSCKNFSEPIQVALWGGDCDNPHVGANVNIIVELGQCTRLPYIEVTPDVDARSIKVVQNGEDEYEVGYYSNVDCTTLLNQFPPVLDGACAYDNTLPQWKSIRANKIPEPSASPTAEAPAEAPTQTPAEATREPTMAITQSPSAGTDIGANSLLLASTAAIVVVVSMGM